MSIVNAVRCDVASNAPSPVNAKGLSAPGSDILSERSKRPLVAAALACPAFFSATRLIGSPLTTVPVPPPPQPTANTAQNDASVRMRRAKLIPSNVGRVAFALILPARDHGSAARGSTPPGAKRQTRPRWLSTRTERHARPAPAGELEQARERRR